MSKSMSRSESPLSPGEEMSLIESSRVLSENEECACCTNGECSAMCAEGDNACDCVGCDCGMDKTARNDEAGSIHQGCHGGPKTVEEHYQVLGMTCASCVGIVETMVGALDGVESVNVNLLQEKMTVVRNEGVTSQEDVLEAIDDGGFVGAFIPPSSGPGKLKFSLLGMTCASCVGIAEHAAGSVNGVLEVAVNLSSESAVVKFDPDLTGPRDIIDAWDDVGFDAKVLSAGDQAVSAEQEVNKARLEAAAAQVALLKLSIQLSFPIFFLTMIGPWIGLGPLLSSELVPGLTWEIVLTGPLATIVQFHVGKRFYVGARKSLKAGGANMDVLVALGTSAAYFFSLFSVMLAMAVDTYDATPFFETSAVLITFVLAGKVMEHGAKGQTTEALQTLMSLQSPTAMLVKKSSGGGNEEDEVIEEISTELLQKGDLVQVQAGGRVPVDGIVTRGRSRVDESLITGESIPVLKEAGASVMSGSMNTVGVLYVRVTKTGQDTALSQIAALVDDAQTRKAPIQAYADYASSIFVPAVVTLSVVTFLAWGFVAHYQLVDPSFYPPGVGGWLFAFMQGISVLVIACPCALGLATPTAVMVGTGVGAKYGILIKGGDVLETSARVNTVCFDKTGTLTEGKPSVTNVVILGAEVTSEDARVRGLRVAGRNGAAVTEQELGEYVAALEESSEHPVGRALGAWGASARQGRGPGARDVSIVAGKGLKGRVGGVMVAIGNEKLVAESVALPAEAAEMGAVLAGEGKTVVYVSVAGTVSAMIGVADALKPEAIAVVAALKADGYSVVMISGDQQATADAIGRAAGIDRVYGHVLPEEKASTVAELQQAKAVVAMVGDGINDSPALAQSDVGIAIGAGTDVAIETANMVLMKSDLRDLLTALDLAKKTFGRIQLNFFWAVVYNILGIPVAAGALYPLFRITLPPMAAGAAMALSSVSVVLSSLQLKYYQPKGAKTVMMKAGKKAGYKNLNQEEEMDELV